MTNECPIAKTIMIHPALWRLEEHNWIVPMDLIGKLVDRNWWTDDDDDDERGDFELHLVSQDWRTKEEDYSNIMNHKEGQFQIPLVDEKGSGRNWLFIEWIILIQFTIVIAAPSPSSSSSQEILWYWFTKHDSLVLRLGVENVTNSCRTWLHSIDYSVSCRIVGDIPSCKFNLRIMNLKLF